MIEITIVETDMTTTDLMRDAAQNMMEETMTAEGHHRADHHGEDRGEAQHHEVSTENVASLAVGMARSIIRARTLVPH